MMPKVGQLLRWIETEVCDEIGALGDDVGIVKKVECDDGEYDRTRGEYEYSVIIDWCKGPHDSYHDNLEYEESVATGEIVVVV